MQSLGFGKAFEFKCFTDSSPTQHLPVRQAISEVILQNLVSSFHHRCTCVHFVCQIKLYNTRVLSLLCAKVSYVQGYVQGQAMCTQAMCITQEHHLPLCFLYAWPHPGDEDAMVRHKVDECPLCCLFFRSDSVGRAANLVIPAC